MTYGKSNAAIRPERAGMRCVVRVIAEGRINSARRGSFFGGSGMDVSDRRLGCRLGDGWALKHCEDRTEHKQSPNINGNKIAFARTAPCERV